MYLLLELVVGRTVSRSRAFVRANAAAPGCVYALLIAPVLAEEVNCVTEVACSSSIRRTITLA